MPAACPQPLFSHASCLAARGPAAPTVESLHTRELAFQNSAVAGKQFSATHAQQRRETKGEGEFAAERTRGVKASGFSVFLKKKRDGVSKARGISGKLSLDTLPSTNPFHRLGLRLSLCPSYPVLARPNFPSPPQLPPPKLIPIHRPDTSSIIDSFSLDLQLPPAIQTMASQVPGGRRTPEHNGWAKFRITAFDAPFRRADLEYEVEKTRLAEKKKRYEDRIWYANQEIELLGEENGVLEMEREIYEEKIERLREKEERNLIKLKQKEHEIFNAAIRELYSRDDSDEIIAECISGAGLSDSESQATSRGEDSTYEEPTTSSSLTMVPSPDASTSVAPPAEDAGPRTSVSSSDDPPHDIASTPLFKVADAKKGPETPAKRSRRRARFGRPGRGEEGMSEPLPVIAHEVSY